MELKMEINNVKSIEHLKFVFPLENGLYAITGENGSGKSTLVACASAVFFRMPMYEYFGHPNQEASIIFELEGTTRSWSYQNKKWSGDSSKEKMKLGGFYEGSIIFGNRFKDTNFSNIDILDKVKDSELTPASGFVSKNLGTILHDDSEYYGNMFVLKKEFAKSKGLSNSTYFYKTYNGELVSQARMSTGENLLVSILNSLSIIQGKRVSSKESKPYIVFLDEIELALHASALRRLVHFLSQISNEYDLAIFFSTHSLELIRGIKPQNIYYLSKYLDNKISVTNPCYPAFATRNLYSEDGYGEDMVIFVEDDLAKVLIDRILLEKELLNNIRIKVLPTGGWTNTIVMAYDVVSSGILLKNTKIAVVLDRDVKRLVPNFIKSHKQYSGVNIDYLPISSVEKYLRENLVLKVDTKLYAKLDNYIFIKRPLAKILNEYKKNSNFSSDEDGKTLYGILINELRSIRKEREDLVEILVKYLLKNNKELVDTLIEYLNRKIND